MEVFGVKLVARYSLRMLAAKAVTVEWAARIHRVPLNEFLEILDRAIAKKQERKKEEHESNRIHSRFHHWDYVHYRGGKAMRGWHPGYSVLTWLPVYNFVMGILSLIPAVLIWMNHLYWLLAYPPGFVKNKYVVNG